MQHRCAHIGELSELTVGYGLDPGRVFDDSGICDHKTRDVRPVFIDVGVAGARDDGSGYIRSSAGKGLYLSVMTASIKTGDHGIFFLFEALSHLPHGPAVIQIPVLFKEDQFDRIQEGISKIGRHDPAVQVLAPGRGEIRIGSFFHSFFYFIELLVKGKILQLQAVDDLLVAAFNLGQNLRKILFVLREGFHLVEKVSHLDVPGITFARGRDYDISSGFIIKDDLADFFKLFCIGERAPAKFYYFHCLRPHRNFICYRNLPTVNLYIKTLLYLPGYFYISAAYSSFIEQADRAADF